MQLYAHEGFRPCGPFGAAALQAQEASDSRRVHVVGPRAMLTISERATGRWGLTTPRHFQVPAPFHGAQVLT